MTTHVRAAFTALILSAGAAQSQDARGFAELRLSAFPGASGDKLQIVERVRPTLEYALMERVKLVTTVEAGLAQGRRTDVELERVLQRGGLGAVVEAGLCCTPEWQNELLRIGGASDYLEVDRLYVDLYAGAADLRFGRQAINWGSAQFFNPTDPFPEVLLTEPWRPRRGVNAARATVPFGDMNDFSAVIATTDALDELRAAARLRVNWEGTDFALIGAWRGEERAMVGVDLRGTLGVGWWLEAAYFPGANAHEEVAVGIDYSFPILERAVVSLQYYRNGAGSTLPGVVGLDTGVLGGVTTQRDPFAPFVSGRDYLLFGASLGINAELSANASVLQNLNDGTGFVVPTVSWGVLDWLELAASAQLPYAAWGDGGEFKPRPEDLRLERDLGPPLGAVSLDLSGLVPAATITVWTRASF